MLVTGSELLDVAAAHRLAVPAFNVSDYSMLRGYLEACEELDAPLILAIHPDELRITGPELVPLIREMALRSRIPVAVHLDHGSSYVQVLGAIQAGFTSVMIDGSLLPFEENVAVTREIVRAAHAVGVSVEAELGTIGATDEHAEAGTTSILYTDPAEAAVFVDRTEVDSLAVAIGTRHGIYPPTLRAALRLDLLEEIAQAVPVPLVLHGGSDNPDEEIREAVRRGIAKVNISSDVKIAYFEAMRRILGDRALREPYDILPECVAAMKEVVADKVRLLGAAGAGGHWRDRL